MRMFSRRSGDIRAFLVLRILLFKALSCSRKFKTCINILIINFKMKQSTFLKRTMLHERFKHILTINDVLGHVKDSWQRHRYDCIVPLMMHDHYKYGEEKL